SRQPRCDRFDMPPCIKLSKTLDPSQGNLRENCEKGFSQSASKDAKNPIKSRVFKGLHKQTKEVFKTASL
ncbi:MAG: hypothetical protein IKB20_00610, partial [Clostridia bacterium]|nr:hypothetical protein [Clostridia bacterium]